jgi:parallel beta-helix repeat protein
MRKSAFFVLFFLIPSLIFSVTPLPVKAQAIFGTITINSDGSITPSGAPITTDGVTYTLTANILSNSTGISINRDGTVLDGGGYLLNASEYGNLDSGVTINGRHDVTIKNMVIEHFGTGIPISGDNCIVSGNTIRGCQTGITVGDSVNVQIADNHIESKTFQTSTGPWQIGEKGIMLIAAQHVVTVTNNAVANQSLYGILLTTQSVYGCKNNVFRNNAMTGNQYNFKIEGNSPETYVNDIDSSNTVDGKPIIYWVDQHDKTVPGYAGCVGLVSCSGITVQDLTLERNGAGVLLVSTTGSTIRNCNIAGNAEGIALEWSSENTVSGNTINPRILNNDYLISESASSHNLIENNILILPEEPSQSSHYGIVSNNCQNETFSGNTIKAYGSGYYDKTRNMFVNSDNLTLTDNVFERIRLQFSTCPNTRIYHNNFIVVYNFLFYGTNTGFSWDNGYPSGGNFWDIPGGTDVFSGPSQNIAGSDGIRDTPYTITGAPAPNNVDNYPLLTPTKPISSTITAYGKEATVYSNSYVTQFMLTIAAKQISFNVTGLSGTLGSCNVSFPSAMLDGPFTVKLDGSVLTQNVGYTQTFNGTHYLFQISYTHSTHKIEIIGTTVIPEFPTIVCILLLLTLLTITFLHIKRKHTVNDLKRYMRS